MMVTIFACLLISYLAKPGGVLTSEGFSLSVLTRRLAGAELTSEGEAGAC
jgi:hypothetical protein